MSATEGEINEALLGFNVFDWMGMGSHSTPFDHSEGCPPNFTPACQVPEADSRRGFLYFGVMEGCRACHVALIAAALNAPNHPGRPFDQDRRAAGEWKFTAATSVAEAALKSVRRLDKLDPLRLRFEPMLEMAVLVLPPKR